MGKDYEIRLDITVDATPDQVWDAVATGPGISSWYIGRTDIDGSTVRTAFGDIAMPAGTVTANEPHRHFRHRTDTAPDGRFQAADFLVEGRAGSATSLRAITSGFLPGDDWADEYEAMRYGTEFFYATLDAHLRHFPGRTATPVTAFGPQITDWPAAWAALHHTLGLPDTPRPGDRTHDGGEVYAVNPHTLGIRTTGALHRYLRGYHGPMIAAHECHEPDDADPARWTAFLHALPTA